MQVVYTVPANRCEAFFITLLDQNSNDKIQVIYPDLVNDKSLGEFSYYEIDEKPRHVFGFQTQGTARELYGESYYFDSSGNYQDYYFLTLDYGFYDEYFWLDPIILPDTYIDDEIGNEYLDNGLYMGIKDRKNIHPNTYGISALPYETTYEIIGGYGSFGILPDDLVNFPR